MARCWLQPEFICNIILEHHSCCQDTFNNSKDVILANGMAILKISEHICQTHYYLGKTNLDYEWILLKEPLLNYLGMNEIEYQSLKKSIQGELQDFLGEKS